MFRVCTASRGFESGLEVGFTRVGLVGDGLCVSGCSSGCEVASGVLGEVTFTGSLVVMASSVLSSCTAAVDRGAGVVKTSSSGRFSDTAGATLVERLGSVTASLAFSVSSGSGFEVADSGLGVRSCVDEAEVVVA